MPRRVALSLGGALAGVVLLFATWYAAFHIGLIEHADGSILNGFLGLKGHPHVSGAAQFIATLCNPKPYVYFAVLPVLVALARRRYRVALVLAAILLGANVTTQLVKPVLAELRTDPQLGFNPVAPASWPSGHATAAMSFVLASVIATPARWRPLVATAGALFAIAVSYSFLTLGWHYPTDVLGGFLVAATWTLLGIAALFATDPSRAPGSPRPVSLRGALTPPVLALFGALALVALAALDRPQAVVSYARAHEAFVIGAAVIGALALALATGLVVTLRRYASSR